MVNSIHTIKVGTINHPGGSVPEGVGLMDYLREQCRALDAAMAGGRGPVVVSVDLDTLEALYDDGIYIGSGPKSLEEIRIQGGRGHG